MIEDEYLCECVMFEFDDGVAVDFDSTSESESLSMFIKFIKLYGNIFLWLVRNMFGDMSVIVYGEVVVVVFEVGVVLIFLSFRESIKRLEVGDVTIELCVRVLVFVDVMMSD